MPSIVLNWLSKNSVRSFPLEEGASKLSDAGTRLPDDILVGAKIKVPSTAGARVCLGGISATPAVVTAVFVATTSAFTSPVPVAAVSVRQPISVGRAYSISPLYTGVGGWVSFGPGAASASSVRSWRFSDPSAAPVVPAEASSYVDLPVPGVTLSFTDVVLTGLVRLTGLGDLVIEGADRTVGGAARRVILFRLDTTRNPEALKDYAGPCAGRPESDTCDFTPIRFINTLRPDANGNININYNPDDFLVLPVSGSGMLAINSPQSMLEACDKADFSLPSGEDVCNDQWLEPEPA